ncbi:MAG TPA: hypothetical protein VFT49_04365 [Candidatus Saccharimonadales bacterium]|nr:hypothetical protein [Candidatus Saccharimonadales bacterium]
MGHKLHSIKRSAAITLAVAILAVLGAVVAIEAPTSHAATASAAPASAQHVMDSTCPVQFAAPIYTCEIQPVGVKTNKSSSSTSHVHVTTKKNTTVTLTMVKRYEKIKHVRVAINGGAPVKTGCVDPTKIKSWNFHDGDSFYNADKFHRELPDTWESGWEICGAHPVRNWHGHPGLYEVGKKKNCRNTPIAIPIQEQEIAVPQKVVEMTKTQFVSNFDRVVKKSSTSTSTKDVEYYCRTAGYNPGVVNGREVCYHVVQIPVGTTPTTPTGTIVCSNIGNNNGGNCNTNTTTTVVTTTTTTPSQSPSCTLNLAESKGNQNAQASVNTTGGSATFVQFTWGDGATDQGSFVSATHTYATPAPAPAGTYVTYTITARAVIGGNWFDCGHRDYKVAAPPTNPTGTNPDGPPGLPNG